MKKKNTLQLVFVVVHLLLSISAASTKTGTVLANDEDITQYHHINVGSAWQPHLCPHYHHLHLRRDRNAALWQELLRSQFQARSNTQVPTNVACGNAL